MKRCLIPAALLLLQGLAWAGASGYEVTGRIDFPGSVHWDRIRYDTVGHRLYVAQPPLLTVIDPDKKTVVGTFAEAKAVHDIVFDHDLNLGFFSDARGMRISAFDLDTLKPAFDIKTNTDTTGLVYETKSKQLVSTNQLGREVATYDPKTRKRTGRLGLEGSLSELIAQRDGTVFVNVATENVLIGVNPRNAHQVSRTEYKACRVPTGLAVDPQSRLFSVCRNGTLVVMSPEGRLLNETTIADQRWSAGIDGVVWQDGHLFVSNGFNATLLVIDETQPNRFEVTETIPTARGARTLAGDPEHHRLFTVAPDIDPLTPWTGPRPLEGSMHVTVIERRE